MVLALLAAAAAAASPVDCSTPTGMEAAWRPTVEAYQARDWAKAKALADALIAACDGRPVGDFPRMMRAEIAIREGDPDAAIAVLGAASRPARPPIGPYSSLIALRAWQAKKDAAAFADERQRLLDGSVLGLSQAGNPFKSRLVETFETKGVKVTAFEADYSDDAFRRHFVFLLAPTEPFAMPGTIMLTTNPMTELLGGRRKAWFIDEYGCWGHATLDIIEGRKPTYKVMKAKVLSRLEGALQAASSFQPDGPVCAFAGYVSPGFAAADADE